MRRSIRRCVSILAFVLACFACGAGGCSPSPGAAPASTQEHSGAVPPVTRPTVPAQATATGARKFLQDHQCFTIKYEPGKNGNPSNLSLQCDVFEAVAVGDGDNFSVPSNLPDGLVIRKALLVNNEGQFFVRVNNSCTVVLEGVTSPGPATILDASPCNN